MFNALFPPSTSCSTMLGTEALTDAPSLCFRLGHYSWVLRAPPPCITHTLGWCFGLSHSLRTPLWPLRPVLSLLLHWFAFKTDIYFFYSSYVLGFSLWQFLTRGSGNLGKTPSTFFNPDLPALLSPGSPPPSLDTLTEPFLGHTWVKCLIFLRK